MRGGARPPPPPPPRGARRATVQRQSPFVLLFLRFPVPWPEARRARIFARFPRVPPSRRAAPSAPPWSSIKSSGCYSSQKGNGWAACADQGCPSRMGGLRGPRMPEPVFQLIVLKVSVTHVAKCYVRAPSQCHCVSLPKALAGQAGSARCSRPRTTGRWKLGPRSGENVLDLPVTGFPPSRNI